MAFSIACVTSYHHRSHEKSFSNPSNFPSRLVNPIAREGRETIEKNNRAIFNQQAKRLMVKQRGNETEKSVSFYAPQTCVCTREMCITLNMYGFSPYAFIVFSGNLVGVNWC